MDCRKSHDGLCALVRQRLDQDPMSGDVFVFFNRRHERVKVLIWDRNGFVLWHKRLERDRFHWPRAGEPVITLTGQELNWLLDGFDLRHWRPHARLHYTHVA